MIRRDDVVRFGAFRLNRRTGELDDSGSLVVLQPQPMRILLELIDRRGELVKREELQRAVWGADTHVDFDQGLNFCVRQIRRALRDSASAPRFVETLPRRGYRFIASVRSEPGTRPCPNPETPGRAACVRRAVALRLAAVLAAALVAAPTQAPAPRPSAARPPRTMLAVLPFQNLAGDAGHEYLSDGLTEQTIHEFARARPERLGVIARTSAMTYKGAVKPIGQVGRELGVEYVLLGSLREGCASLSVAARLVRVRDEAQLWSESFDVSQPDALLAQSEAAERISRALRARLLPLDRQDVVGA